MNNPKPPNLGNLFLFQYAQIFAQLFRDTIKHQQNVNWEGCIKGLWILAFSLGLFVLSLTTESITLLSFMAACVVMIAIMVLCFVICPLSWEIPAIKDIEEVAEEDSKYDVALVVLMTINHFNEKVVARNSKIIQSRVEYLRAAIWALLAQVMLYITLSLNLSFSL